MFLLEIIPATAAALLHSCNCGFGRYHKSQRRITLKTAHPDRDHFVTKGINFVALSFDTKRGTSVKAMMISNAASPPNSRTMVRMRRMKMGVGITL